MAMHQPDFAQTSPRFLPNEDLAFILARFPGRTSDSETMATTLRDADSTLETMLDSGFVAEAVLENDDLLLDISPALLFQVLLRQTLNDRRSPIERQVVNYLANLLNLFVHSDRVERPIASQEISSAYLVELIETATRVTSPQRFEIEVHIGNYALFLAGIYGRWIEHRHRYHKRLVGTDFYRSFGRSYYHQAAAHPLAHRLGLHGVLTRLSEGFDHYVDALNELSRRYLHLR